MDCPFCCEPFDLQARRPKVLACGHSACIDCLSLSLSQCADCKKEIVGPVSELPDNLLAVHVIEKEANNRTGARFWCTRCSQVASSACEDQHPVVSLKVALRPQVKQLQRLSIPHLSEDVRHQLEFLALDCGTGLVKTALDLFLEPGTSCDLVLRNGNGQQTFSATLLDDQESGKEPDLEDRLVKVLALVLAKKGKLKKVVCQQKPEVKPEQKPEQKPHVCKIEQPGPEVEAIIDSINMAERCKEAPNAGQQKKSTILDRIGQHGVFQLTNVSCTKDPAWTLQLLKRAAPTLVELKLADPAGDHLIALQSMPRLRRLYVNQSIESLRRAVPCELPALPDGQAGLQWLSVSNLPRATLMSLLRTHGHSLREVHLHVGTPGDHPWPASCNDLHADLAKCGLSALQVLVLWRYYSCTLSCTEQGHYEAHHPLKEACRAQLTSLRRVLPPQTQVHCGLCDGCSDAPF